MLILLSFIFGASIGSFVQVIATRFRVASITHGRSKCLSCGEALRASDLIPVLSYLLLKGKCRYCKTKYGMEAIIVECIYGLVFVALYLLVLSLQPSLLLSFVWLVYYTLLFIVLGAMALYDRAHSYIPFPFLLSYLLLTLLMYIIRFQSGYDILSTASPILVAIPFLIIWLVTKGKGLGFGDVILFFGVGAFFGALSGFAVLALSVWSGAIVGVYKKYFSAHKAHMSSSMPFVPFIVFSFLIVLFTGIDIFSIVELFS